MHIRAIEELLEALKYLDSDTPAEGMISIQVEEKGDPKDKAEIEAGIDFSQDFVDSLDPMKKKKDEYNRTFK